MNYYISDEEIRNQIKGFVGIAPILKSLASLPDNMAGIFINQLEKLEEKPHIFPKFKLS